MTRLCRLDHTHIDTHTNTWTHILTKSSVVTASPDLFVATTILASLCCISSTLLLSDNIAMISFSREPGSWTAQTPIQMNKSPLITLSKKALGQIEIMTQIHTVAVSGSMSNRTKRLISVPVKVKGSDFSMPSFCRSWRTLWPCHHTSAMDLKWISYYRLCFLWLTFIRFSCAGEKDLCPLLRGTNRSNKACKI